MKKILPLIALFLGITLAASAQDNRMDRKERQNRGQFRQERVEKRSPEEIAKMRTEHMDKKLNLSEQQRAEIYAFHLDRAKRFDTRAEAMKVQREAQRQEMKAEHEKLKNILTPEQQEIMKKEMQANRKRITRDRPGFRHRTDGERPMRRKMEQKPAATE